MRSDMQQRCEPGTLWFIVSILTLWPTRYTCIVIHFVNYTALQYIYSGLITVHPR